MNVSELFGWSAAGLTLLTFAARNLCAARLVALAANACFIAYAVTGGFLLHVLALHLTLVPINLLRLAEIRKAQRRPLPGRDARSEQPATPRDRPSPCELRYVGAHRAADHCGHAARSGRSKIAGDAAAGATPRS